MFWFCVANVAICHTQSCTYMYVSRNLSKYVQHQVNTFPRIKNLLLNEHAG